jgi:hypothetical protein
MRAALHDLVEGLRDVSLDELLGAIGIAAVLCLPAAISEYAETMPDHSAEQLIARKAIAAEAEDRRRNAGARAMCAEALGENSSPVWLTDGSVRCADKRGRVMRTAVTSPRGNP